MKKLLLLGLSLLSATTLLAQSSADSYIPLVVEGVTWRGDMKIRHNNSTENQESYAYTIELKGDTTINDLSYKKCFYHFFNKKVYDNTTLRGFLRENKANQQVFYLANENYTPLIKFDDYENPTYKLDNEILLYDFANITNPQQYWVANGGVEYLEGAISTREITLEDGISRPYHNIEGAYIIQGVGVMGNDGAGHDLINVYSINDNTMPQQSCPLIYAQKDSAGTVVFDYSDQIPTYLPLALEGNKWLCGRVDVNSNGVTHTPYCYVIKGDKELNGQVYKCCYRLVGNDTISNANLFALLRDDCQDYKTYVVYPDLSSEETVLYDFRNPLNPDMLKHFGYDEELPSDVKIEETYGVVHSPIIYSYEYSLKLSAMNYNLYYIEGVGFDGTQKCDLFNAPTDDIPGTEYSYLQFYKLLDANDNVVYTSPAIDPTISSDDYVPLVKEGVRWECEIVRVTKPDYVEQEYHYPYDIVISGDSVINDMEYKKCHYLFKGCNNEPCDTTVIAFLREDVLTKRVYAIFSGDYQFPIPHVIPEYSCDVATFTFDKEELLYDFADIRNTNQYWGYMSSYTATDTIIDNVSRKMYLNNVESDNPFGLIEGIGNMGNPNVTGDLLFPNPVSNVLASLPTRYTDPVFLNYYNEKGELVYSSGRLASTEKVSIDDDCTIITINNGVISTRQDALIEVVDLNGRIVTTVQGVTLSISNLPAGLYIVRATTSSATQTSKVIVK